MSRRHKRPSAGSEARDLYEMLQYRHERLSQRASHDWLADVWFDCDDCIDVARNSLFGLMIRAYWRRVTRLERMTDHERIAAARTAAGRNAPYADPAGRSRSLSLVYQKARDARDADQLRREFFSSDFAGRVIARW